MGSVTAGAYGRMLDDLDLRDVILMHYLTVDCNQNLICAAFEKLESCTSCISCE